MAELKTKKNNASVAQFLKGIEDEEKRADAKKLLKIFEEVTKKKGAMWGESMVGFGSYHYKYASGREGDWFRVGFSPRKNYIAVYMLCGYSGFKDKLAKLGKHKVSSGSCLYIKKLSDVSEGELRKIILDGWKAKAMGEV